MNMFWDRFQGYWSHVVCFFIGLVFISLNNWHLALYGAAFMTVGLLGLQIDRRFDKIEARFKEPIQSN